MEAKVAQRPHISSWIDPEKIARKPSSSVRFHQISREQKRPQVLISAYTEPRRGQSRHRLIAAEVSRPSKNFPASLLESSGNFNGSFDEALILKNKAQEIEPYLNGRCIYLVGMMGSGKTTVGRILSQVLNYSFCDSDSLIEEDAGGTAVSDIFKLYGEGYFREKETEILRRLSIMHRLVVSTGGGAVIRPINWKHMRRGISVWIDVPLEALAQRIAAVGTHSRPLLHNESGDPYTKAYNRLSMLLEERSEAYSNANARVSLENIAAKQGLIDVSFLSPTAIAIEALEQIQTCLEEGDGKGMSFGML